MGPSNFSLQPIPARVTVSVGCIISGARRATWASGVRRPGTKSIMKALGWLSVLLLATGCGSASVDYFWNEKSTRDFQCFRTVFIRTSAGGIVYETDPDFIRTIRSAARGQSLAFHFVDTIERADLVLGAVKHPKVVTTHAEASVDTNWAVILVRREDLEAASRDPLQNSMLIAGEVGFGVSIPKQVIKALDHVHQATCRE